MQDCTVRNSASHCVGELLLSREKKKAAEHEKDTMPKTVPHPRRRAAGRVSCLTARVKG